MIVLRNIAFYLVFYLGSIVVTSAALLSIPFGWEVFRRRVSNWSGLQRWCVVNLLGVDLKIEGAPLDEPPPRPQALQDHRHLQQLRRRVPQLEGSRARRREGRA